MDIQTLNGKRPFDEQPQLFELEAEVISAEKCEEGFKIICDRTIFFPRGGGQPCDGGRINGIEVLDVFDEGGEIIHLLSSPVEPGAGVHMEIDRENRLRHMRYHSAQHILSACLHELFGIDTVIARIEEGGGHIELPSPLSPEQLSEGERYANEIIKRDLAINTAYHTPEEIKNYNVRGRITPHELIRLVTVEGFDINACGGTHCPSTGMIGRLVITGVKEVRGAYRIYYKTGPEAEAEISRRTAGLLKIQQSVGAQSLDEGVDKTAELAVHARALEEEQAKLKVRLAESDHLALLAGGKRINDSLFIMDIIESDDTKHYKAAADRLVKENHAAVMLALADGENISLILSRPKGDGPDMGGHLKTLMAELGGKGGGSPVQAQGMVPNTERAITEINKTAEKIMEEMK